MLYDYFGGFGILDLGVLCWVGWGLKWLDWDFAF